ncbi:hypothetical protein EHZ19_24665 [Paraburkholderia bannensis]|nr:hypothetical protein [Paraburkholderia bannensis]RQM45166.1 hypothetical protein EHZ19_24665 [Paraburkholderia bannensis]
MEDLMEIDLREIQALHARYAREPVVIDLEAQMRARPAPLLLAHDPAVSASALRRMWKARANVGRGALMTVGGTFICAAIGMGAAKLYGSIAHASHAAAHAQTTVAATATSPASYTAASANGSASALTASDFDQAAGRTGSLAAVDPAALMGQSPQAATGQVAPPAAPDNYMQRAAASPIRQARIQRPDVQSEQTPAIQPVPAAVREEHPPAKPQPSTHTAAAATPAASQAEASAPVAPAMHVSRHAPRRHLAPIHEAPPANPDAKPAEAKPAAGRGGDVQLF